MHTPSKISQLDESSRRDHDVLWLDVAMDDVVAVQEADCVADLPNDCLDVFERHSFSTLLHQRIECFLACVLLDEIDASFIMKDTV